MIGRNDPCHCGSGRKYKKCCLALDESGRAETQGAFERVARSVAAGGRAEHYGDALVELIRHGPLADLRFDEELFEKVVSRALLELEDAPESSREELYSRVRSELVTPVFLREAERKVRAVSARGGIAPADREALAFGALLAEASRGMDHDRDVLATLVFDAQMEEFFDRVEARGKIESLVEELRAGRIDYAELRRRTLQDPGLLGVAEAPGAQAEMERSANEAYQTAVAAFRSDSPPDVLTGPEAVYLWCIALPFIQPLLRVEDMSEEERKALLERLVEAIDTGLSDKFVETVADRTTQRALQAERKTPEASVLGAVAVAFGDNPAGIAVVMLFAGLPAQFPNDEEREAGEALFSRPSLVSGELDGYAALLERREDREGLALLVAARAALEGSPDRATG